MIFVILYKGLSKSMDFKNYDDIFNCFLTILSYPLGNIVMIPDIENYSYLIEKNFIFPNYMAKAINGSVLITILFL
jgi:hypothetical protein